MQRNGADDEDDCEAIAREIFELLEERGDCAAATDEEVRELACHVRSVLYRLDCRKPGRRAGERRCGR